MQSKQRDSTTMPTAAQLPSLESLPLTWLSQLAKFMPAHQRLKLRQCSRQMQQLVDTTGLRHHFGSVLSLSLVVQQLSSLDVTGLATLHKCNEKQLQHTSELLTLTETSNLPCLTHLVCGSTQLQLLVAIAHCSPKLAHVTLHFKGGLTEQDHIAWELLPAQAPGLLASLCCLEMDHRCHKQFLDQPCMQRVVGACTHLQSLVMRMPKAKDYALRYHELCEQVWQQAIQPLNRLTRLEMGMRLFRDDPSSNSEGSDAAHSAAKQTRQLVDKQCTDRQSFLQHLKCFGFDSPFQDNWNLAWLGQHTNLSCLDLMFVSSGEVDFDVLAQLQQLCTLSLHCSPDELFTSSQLAPLSSCTNLTCLRLDTLVIEPGHTAGPANMTPGLHIDADTGAAEVGLLLQDSASGDLGMAASGTPSSWAATAHAPAAQVALPQLCSLQKLVAGLLCQAPVSSLAPNLTQLRDLDYDLGMLELSSSFLNEHPPAGEEPLASLNNLQLLAVNMLALVRHAATPSLTQLPNLKELHLDMVGNLDGTCIGAPGGLPRLPQLTKLVMKLDTQGCRNLLKTYSTEEDVLLWQNQQSVRHLRIRGSKLLGGFMVHDHLLKLLPGTMPHLQLIELVKCVDLTGPDLAKLVNSCAARRILVQGCTQLSERDCLQLQQSAGCDVVVDYTS